MPRKKQDTEDESQYMHVVKKDVDRRVTDLKGQMDDVQKKATKTMQERPLLALGVAFLAGMALGILLANAGD